MNRGGQHSLAGQLTSDFFQMSNVVGPQLCQNIWEHLRSRFAFDMARDRERVGQQRGLGLGVIKMDGYAVVFDNIHLRDAKDCVHDQ